MKNNKMMPKRLRDQLILSPQDLLEVECFQEGYNAYQCKISVKLCPYKFKLCGEAWIEGWEQAHEQAN